MKIKEYNQMMSYLTRKPSQREKDVATIKRNTELDLKQKGNPENILKYIERVKAGDDPYRYVSWAETQETPVEYDKDGYPNKASPEQMAELKKRLDKAREMTGGPNKKVSKKKPTKVVKGPPIQLELPLDNPNENIIEFKPQPLSPFGTPGGWMDKVELKSDVFPGETLQDYMKRKEYEHQVKLVNEGLKIGIGTLIKRKKRKT